MSEHDDMTLKRAMDALPRTIEPPEDLWPGVRARIARPAALRLWQRPGLRIAALLTLLAASAATLAITRQRAGLWQVAAGDTVRRFRPGEALRVGVEPARLTVGSIGHVDVAPGTEVRLLAARWSGHRLALARGSVHASISAPPRLFIVETPSGTAVDLGCEYTLDVDSAGSSTIRVTLGWVSFENHGAVSLVPAGMRARAIKGGAIGTPYREDAPLALREALASVDAHTPGDAALDLALAAARRQDAVSLWHLVARTAGERRTRVLDRLTALVPARADIPRAALERADPRAMELYWTTLPGTLPIIPEWRSALWRFWLRVAG
jgi:hypothetical protein